jgi:ankyrin repeat protein
MLRRYYFIVSVLILLSQCVSDADSENTAKDSNIASLLEQIFTEEASDEIDFNLSIEEIYKSYVYSKGEDQFCSMHHIQLQKDIVPSGHGRGSYLYGYHEASNNFPNSKTEHVLGGGGRYSSGTREVLYCSRCREVEQQWIEEKEAVRKAELLDEIKQAANINQADANGTTFLHSASAYGCTDIVKRLIDEGSNVNPKSVYGSTPLHYAANNNHSDVVKILIENGAEIDARGSYDRTPLHFAAWFASKDVVKLLVENGANVNALDNDPCSPNTTPLYFAHHFNDLYKEVAFYLEQQGGVMDPEFIQQIEKSPNVNNKDVDGFTLLHEAAENGEYNAVKMLIDKGADVNIRNNSDDTPLHYCRWEPHPGVVKILVDAGADINAKDHSEETPLHALAQGYGSAAAVKILIDAGANVNAQDDTGNTPLHTALIMTSLYDENKLMMKTLLEAGADVSIKNDWDETPLDEASRDEELAKLLRQYKPNLSNSQ